MRLTLCVSLFLTVYIGKETIPGFEEGAGSALRGVIGRDIELKHSLYTLGKSLSGQGDPVKGWEEFCVEVFGPIRESEQENTPTQQVPKGADGEEEPVNAEQVEDPEPTGGEQLPEVVYTIGQVLSPARGDEELPEGYQPACVYLGQEPCITPVTGRITSTFGFRDHPTKERYSIHDGVDIGADSGTDIAAFRDGVVSDVGEDSDFGKYIWVEHGHGVRTFYAHCSGIEAAVGDEVKAGERIARVGSTGQSTGPHLHFEIRLNNVRLDPLHYIDPEQG